MGIKQLALNYVILLLFKEKKIFFITYILEGYTCSVWGFQSQVTHLKFPTLQSCEQNVGEWVDSLLLFNNLADSD